MSTKKKNRKFAWCFLLTIEGLGIICLGGLLLFVISSHKIKPLFHLQRATVDAPENEAANTAVSIAPIPQDTGNFSGEGGFPVLETTPPLPDVQVLIPPAEVFSPETIDRVSPDEILEEVSYYPGGGVVTCSETVLDRPKFYVLAPEAIEVDWMGTFSVFVCGWKPDEAVALSITYPDTTVETKILVAQPWDTLVNYAIVYDFPLDLNLQAGDYHIVFEGESGTFEQIYRVGLSPTPHLYSISHNNSKYLVLYGFAPDESIRILSYQTISEERWGFVGWKAYQVNQDGRLLIEIVDGGSYFFALGNVSGLIEDSSNWAIPPHEDILKH